MPKATALATAVATTSDPAIKNDLEHQFISAVSAPDNHLNPEERHGLFNRMMMGEGVINMSRPAVQAASRLSLQYIDELESDPKTKAQAAAMTSLMAKPGSETERLAVRKFRDYLEQLPVEERRATAHEVSQMITMIRDHPRNVTAERHGGAALEQAKAVLEGRRHASVELSTADKPASHKENIRTLVEQGPRRSLRNHIGSLHNQRASSDASSLPSR